MSDINVKDLYNWCNIRTDRLVHHPGLKIPLRLVSDSRDTIIALAQRSFGSAYQFVPPMSITLGLKECLSAKSATLQRTGSWKQTALRVALFLKETAEYPITMLQTHPDALITSTFETASHPIGENHEWEFQGVNV